MRMFMRKQPKFGDRNHKPERWRKLSSEEGTFVLRSPVFVQRGIFNWVRPPTLRYRVHPWIEEATRKSVFLPNPDRPVFLDINAGGVLTPLGECGRPAIRRGDLVWISFSINIVWRSEWDVEYIPREIVRVATVSPRLVRN